MFTKLLMATVSIVAGAALATGCSSRAGSGPSSDSGGQHSATESPTQVVESPTHATSEFEGTWHAGPTPVRTVLGHLASVHLGKWTPDFLDGHAPEEQITYDLKLQGGVVLTTSTIDGKPQGVMDRERYQAGAHTISFSPFGSDCSSAFRWSVTGDRLTLRPSTDSCPAYQGVPDSVYMHSLYGSASYIRTR